MRPSNMLLLDTMVVLVKDGEQIDFQTLEKFEEYLGRQCPELRGYNYICYLPDEPLCVQDTERDHESNAQYDALLAQFSELKVLKEDKFFGLSVQEAIALKLAQLKDKNDKEDAKPFEYPSGSGVFYKVTTAIERTILQNEVVLGLGDEAEIPQNNGKWDNVDGTVSTAFSVGGLKSLYNTGYAIPEYNYQIFKSHAAAIMQLSSVEAVKQYDITTGWR